MLKNSNEIAENAKKSTRMLNFNNNSSLPLTSNISTSCYVLGMIALGNEKNSNEGHILFMKDSKLLSTNYC